MGLKSSAEIGPWKDGSFTTRLQLGFQTPRYKNNGEPSISLVEH